MTLIDASQMILLESIERATPTESMTSMLNRDRIELETFMARRAQLTAVLKSAPYRMPTPVSIGTGGQHADVVMQFDASTDVVELYELLMPMTVVVHSGAFGQEILPAFKFEKGKLPENAIEGAFPVHTYTKTEEDVFYARWWTQIAGLCVLVYGPGISKAQSKKLAPSYKGRLFQLKIGF